MGTGARQNREPWTVSLSIGILLAFVEIGSVIALRAAFSMANALLIGTAAVMGTICLIGWALTASRMLLIAIGINVIGWIGFGQAVLTATALEGSETSADPIERLFMLVTNSGAVLYASTALLLCGAVYSFVLLRNFLKTLNDRSFNE